MKNKKIGGCVLSTQPDQLKRPQCKNAKNYQISSGLNIFVPPQILLPFEAQC